MKARPLLLGGYDAAAVRQMFAEAGVLDAIARRGYRSATIEIDDGAGPLTHTRLFAERDGRRFLLLDACLTELHLEPGAAEAWGYHGNHPLDLVVAYWLREQDPTAEFDAAHPRLPLQDHPGLGVLRKVFRVALRMARETGKQGIAALPKFFHDGAIFYRSRLFLFLDPVEQGRFEALERDLCDEAALGLADASLALAGGAVRDEEGRCVQWKGGLQVMPLTPELTSYFHAESYQARCRETAEGSRFHVDDRALRAAREVFETQRQWPGGPDGSA